MDHSYLELGKINYFELELEKNDFSDLELKINCAEYYLICHQPGNTYTGCFKKLETF